MRQPTNPLPTSVESAPTPIKPAANQVKPLSVVDLEIEHGARANGCMSKLPDNISSAIGSEYLVSLASNHSVTSRYP